jgi:hypothetical protein
MSAAKYKQRIMELFQKLSIDSKELGIQLESDIKLESEAKLADGTMIYSSASEWSVGSDVFTKDAEGNAVPAPAGEYQLEDGSMLIVDDKGLVAEIKTPDMEEEMSKEDMFAMVSSLADRISALEQERTSLVEELSAEKKKNEKISGDLTAMRTELSSLKKAPAVSSVKDRSQVKLSSSAAPAEKSFSEMSLRERIQYNFKNK